MYVKVVQFTSTSKMQKEMLGAYLQTVWFPELIELGALSCRYISLDDTKTVSAIEVRDETSGKTIAYLDERSPTPGDTFGVTEQMFSTLRRKPR